MKDGFIKVAAATPKIKVGDTKYNSRQIIAQIKERCREQGEDYRATRAVRYRIHLRRPVFAVRPD